MVVGGAFRLVGLDRSTMRSGIVVICIISMLDLVIFCRRGCIMDSLF